MNQFLKRALTKRERRVQRTYLIDDVLYAFLKKTGKEYNISTSDLLNMCIFELETLFASQNYQLYIFKKGTNYALHTFQIDISNVEKLQAMKKRTSLKIKTLINMSIFNVVQSKK